MGGTRYCPICQGEDGCYYFTPNLEAIQNIAGFDEGRETEIAEGEAEKLADDLRAIEEISNEKKNANLPIKPYFEEKGLVIFHGDNREILPQLGIFDLILTDPPYGVGLEYSAWKDTQANLKELIKTSFPLIRRSATVVLLTPGNGNQYKYPEPDWTLAWVVPAAVTRGAWGFCSWQPVLAYGKDPYLREGGGARPDIIICNEASDVNGHPCPKPNTVWKWLLQRGASRSTDRILDPFLGSGTTLWAAKQLGHSAIGIEIEERYCEIAAKRLSQGVLEL